MELNVCLALLTTTAAEPNITGSFIAGYQANGSIWTGNLTVRENQYAGNGASGIFGDEYLGQDIVTFNAAGHNSAATSVFRNNMFNNVGYVVPAGGNFYHYPAYLGDLNYLLRCGAGYYDNVTGYKCDFFDIDPYANDNWINWAKNTSTIYAITGISRWTTSSIGLYVNLSGQGSTSFLEHGIPIRILGLSGSNISPLPINILPGGYAPVLTFGNSAGFCLISYTPTAGTIGGFQSVTGFLQLGSTTNRTILRASNYGFWGLFLGAFGVTIYGTGSFDGGYQATGIPNGDGFGDKFEIDFNLSGGLYGGSGRVREDTQSYSTPYIAGLYADVMKQLSDHYGRKMSHWEIRYFIGQTSSSANSYDIYNGYGKINVAAAVAFGKTNPPIPDNPYDDLGPIGTITVTKVDEFNATINIDQVTNATDYKIYLNGELFAETTAHGSSTWDISRIFTSQGENSFTYKAFNPNRESPSSEECRYLHYKWIRLKLHYNRYN